MALFTRLVWVLGLPFILMIVAPSIIGAIILDSNPLESNIVLPAVGFCIVIGFPVTVLTAWWLTKTKKQNLDHQTGSV